MPTNKHTAPCVVISANFKGIKTGQYKIPAWCQQPKVYVANYVSTYEDGIQMKTVTPEVNRGVKMFGKWGLQGDESPKIPL